MSRQPPRTKLLPATARRLANASSLALVTFGVAASSAAAAIPHPAAPNRGSVLVRSVATGGSLARRSSRLPGSPAGSGMRPDVVAAYSAVRGTTISGGGRWPDVGIGYFWYNGAKWVWSGYLTTSNGSGNYSLSIPAGYWIQMYGLEQYGGGAAFTDLWGYSAEFYTNGGSVNAQITQSGEQTYGG